MPFLIFLGLFGSENGPRIHTNVIKKMVQFLFEFVIAKFSLEEIPLFKFSRFDISIAVDVYYLEQRFDLEVTVLFYFANFITKVAYFSEDTSRLSVPFFSRDLTVTIVTEHRPSTIHGTFYILFVEII